MILIYLKVQNKIKKERNHQQYSCFFVALRMRRTDQQIKSFMCLFVYFMLIFSPSRRVVSYGLGNAPRAKRAVSTATTRAPRCRCLRGNDGGCVNFCLRWAAEEKHSATWATVGTGLWLECDFLHAGRRRRRRRERGEETRLGPTGEPTGCEWAGLNVEHLGAAVVPAELPGCSLQLIPCSAETLRNLHVPSCLQRSSGFCSSRRVKQLIPLMSGNPDPTGTLSAFAEQKLQETWCSTINSSPYCLLKR